MLPVGTTIVGLRLDSPEQLVANPANFRVHPADQREAVRASLEEHGWVEPVVENRRTGYLLNGHLRAEIAVEMGTPLIPVLEVDVDPELEGQIILSLDPTSEMAYADRSVVDEVMQGVRTQSEVLRQVFDNVLLKSVESTPEVDPAESRRKTFKHLLAQARSLRTKIVKAEVHSCVVPVERLIDRLKEEQCQP
jgi:hypothetical protein